MRPPRRVVHPNVPYDELLPLLSQYTAGLQAYWLTGVRESSAAYVHTCRPNKLWDYLAAGIPTIGYQGGPGMKVYAGKWGVVLRGLERGAIAGLQLPEIPDSLRFAETIEADLPRVRAFMASVWMRAAA
jgi:hypothetical protein